MSILRQPFLHFLILGGAVFAASAVLTPPEEEAREPLVVDEAFVRSISEAWQAKLLRKPRPSELSREVENRLETELLYREGVARGLDQGDIIVKRRVAQKMEFLVDELAGVMAPSDAEVRAAYDRDRPRYQTQARVTLSQSLFAGPDGKERASRAAAEARALAAGAVDAGTGDVEAPDATALPARLRAATPDEVKRVFGRAVAEAVFAAAETGVLDPVQSSFGWHLLRLEELVPAEPQPFEQVQAEIRGQLEKKRRAEAKDVFLQELRKRYAVRYEVELSPVGQVEVEERK